MRINGGLFQAGDVSVQLSSEFYALGGANRLGKILRNFSEENKELRCFEHFQEVGMTKGFRI